MSEYCSYFRLPEKNLKVYSVMHEGEEEPGVEWLVQFQLKTAEIDDSFDDTSLEEVIIVAVDFDTAYKYAQQYIRTKQLDSETKDDWADAEIVSVDKK